MSKSAFASEEPAETVARVSFTIIDGPDPTEVQAWRQRLAGSGDPSAYVAGYLAQYVRSVAESGTVSAVTLRKALALATVWDEMSRSYMLKRYTCTRCAQPTKPGAGLCDACEEASKRYTGVPAVGSLAGVEPRQDKAL